MTLTPEQAKCFVDKLRDSKLFKSKQYNLKACHIESAYRFSLSDSLKAHIAIDKEKSNQGVLVYVNKLSIDNISFFDSFAKLIPVSKKYNKGDSLAHEHNSNISKILTLPSFFLSENDVLRLIIASEDELELLIAWYIWSPINRKFLEKCVIKNDYSIFRNSPFEPSSCETILKENLNLKNLEKYLNRSYGVGEDLDIYKERIEEFTGHDRAKNLITKNESEYFKIISHFAILSKVKQGWYNLFLVSTEKQSQPSLSVLPSKHSFKKSKELNDAIIRCYYARLLQGMTKQDRNRYQILEPDEFLPCRFDKLLMFLDRAIQDLFCYTQQSFCGYYDDGLLPDTGSDETFKKMRLLLYDFFKYQNKEDYRSDKRLAKS